MKYLATVNGTTFEVDINEDSHVTVDGERYEIDFRAIGNGPLYSLLIGGNSYEGHIEGTDDGWQVLHKGDLYMVEIEDERSQRLMSLGGAGASTKGDYYLKAPMPGLVVSVPVKEGQEIRQGDILVVLESMKMQNELKSPLDGTILRIQVNPEDTIQQDAVLLVLSPSDDQ
ncbi:MAG: hypothetical protein CL606_06400 [Anaerolineaceae bacterium]|nr:hypothetical protein [Anaerolineaceae bacterium]|tara:strand:- start:19176 stop:19688 length:513 start_codon:yes stop_codon:yes gene_type:complete